MRIRVVILAATLCALVAGGTPAAGKETARPTTAHKACGPTARAKQTQRRVRHRRARVATRLATVERCRKRDRSMVREVLVAPWPQAAAPPAQPSAPEPGQAAPPVEELAHSVQVRAREYSLTLSRSVVAAGEVNVEFHTVNAEDPHDLHLRDSAGNERPLFDETRRWAHPAPAPRVPLRSWRLCRLLLATRARGARHERRATRALARLRSRARRLFAERGLAATGACAAMVPIALHPTRVRRVDQVRPPASPAPRLVVVLAVGKHGQRAGYRSSFCIAALSGLMKNSAAAIFSSPCIRPRRATFGHGTRATTGSPRAVGLESERGQLCRPCRAPVPPKRKPRSRRRPTSTKPRAPARRQAVCALLRKRGPVHDSESPPEVNAPHGKPAETRRGWRQRRRRAGRFARRTARRPGSDEPSESRARPARSTARFMFAYRDPWTVCSAVASLCSTS